MARELTVFSALTGAVAKRASTLQPVYGGGDRGWMTWSSGGEPFMGAFQQDVHVDRDRVLANWAVFACMTLIAGDVGKLRIKLLERDGLGIWTETDSPAFSPVLRKPNGYQTRQKFIESWIFSKLAHGNTYVLKERDNRGVVVALYVLDPQCVKVLVAERGDVYYELKADNLSHVAQESVVVPASEIIHDRMWCLHHPLVGLSPIFASGLAATQGLKIQNSSARFFANLSRPSGILSSEQELKDDLAKQYKANWIENYGPGREGHVAVLGNGLKYQTLAQTAKDSELVDQLKMTAEMVCSTFHVPAYKVGVGTMPTYQNAETLNQIYYDTCLQPLIEAVEALLDDGLGLGSEGTTKNYGTELDLDALLRMDQAGQIAFVEKFLGSGAGKINEARARLNLAPVTGGDTPYLQQQNYSLEALDKRDKGDDPFGKAAAAVKPSEAPPPAGPDAKALVDQVVSTLVPMVGKRATEAMEALRSEQRAIDAERLEREAVAEQRRTESEQAAVAKAEHDRAEAASQLERACKAAEDSARVASQVLRLEEARRAEEAGRAASAQAESSALKLSAVEVRKLLELA